ncbi:hypothetical protein CK203_042113 [Vitis vinifera]|uniref:Uncharacterized protein n=1 Tax=Vitis vinifera TaxID=29760 RepID=A0A438HHD3_VITVI|nr:hypothetical protein CK203_042113 [Vitis vinifera]
MGKEANSPPAYVRLTGDETREDRACKGKVPVLVGGVSNMEPCIKIPCDVERLRRTIEMISKDKRE